MSNQHKSKFPWSLWRYTWVKENLFDLSKDELEWFKLFVAESDKYVGGYL